MSEAQRWWGIGKRVAPPRFVLFVLIFAAGLAVAVPILGNSRGIMSAFDLAAFVFLASLASLFRRGEATQMRAASRANDANRAVLLGVTGATMLVILVAVYGELKGKNDAAVIALVVATLALAWLFSNMIYALHYASLFYLTGGDGNDDAGGIDFPDTKEPDYWDFVYFSFTLGMTFQTSDVEITSGRIRRVVIGQCLAAFVFNLGILAFTINTIGNAGG